MMHDGDARHNSEVPTTPPVAPAISSDEPGEDVTTEEREGKVVHMLCHYNAVLLKVADVHATGPHLGLHEHPANMCVH